jgi:hypothetical protein
MRKAHNLVAILSLAGGIGLTATICSAQESAETALTIYSTTTPGAVAPELYRPVPGQNSQYGRAVPGYGVVRQLRELQLQQGFNQLRFSDVAAYIDPTTVNFTSLTDPDGTRVLEQSFQFDLVSAEKLLEQYIDQRITVDQGSGEDLVQIEGRLLSANGGLILAGDDGRIHAVRSYTNIHFPDLPGGLMTRPTLLWNIAANRSGDHDTRVSYQTSGLTWWADYNLVYSEGENANSGYLDFGAWVSILNRSGASYDDARLKLIAGDVNRAQPLSRPRIMRALEEVATMDQAGVAGFDEQSVFEFHLYTLGRSTTIPDNSTKQIELMPRVQRVAAIKRLVYYGLEPAYGYYGSPATDRDLGLPMNSKVDVYLEFENEEQAGLGVPLPAGRIRVSQLDEADNTLELVGEDVIDHTPRDETVVIKLGSAFDVVGERRQVDFRVDYDDKRLDETIEVTLRNHKDSEVEVLVKETMFRWTNNDIVESNQRYERQDARTVHFPVTVAANDETTVQYRVRYTW